MTVREYNRSVEDHADHIFRFLLGSLRQKELAEDIVQDTFEKLWVKRENVSYEKVKTYLFTTAYHTMIDRLRKEKRVVSMEESMTEESSEEMRSPDLNEILHEALDKLPSDQKAVVLLRDYEGYSYREIGEITGMTEAQVKINIFRGRRFLKNYIGSIEVLV
jgi:RNA polymerase sigma-70 factor (ECF subfamily)